MGGAGPPDFLDKTMPSLLMADSPIEVRRQLFQVWLQRGDKAKALAFGEGKADFEGLK